MTPQDLFLYEKKMVNWFGDDLQGVKWLGNPPYLVNSTEFCAILYFLQFLEVNTGYITCVYTCVGYGA
jgi:hypothetical protein